MKPTAATSNTVFLREAPASTPVPQPAMLWTRPDAASGDRGLATQVRLTPRQLEVLALLCEGLPNKLICRRLNIATGTVKIHISCILRELGVTSRLQAALSARRCGLLGEFTVGEQERGSGEALAGASSAQYQASRQFAAVA